MGERAKARGREDFKGRRREKRREGSKSQWKSGAQPSPLLALTFSGKKFSKTLNTSTLKNSGKMYPQYSFLHRDIFFVQKKNGGSSTRARGRGDPRGGVLRKKTRRNDDDSDDDEAL